MTSSEKSSSDDCDMNSDSDVSLSSGGLPTIVNGDPDTYTAYDSLVFYLTKHLTPAEDRRIRSAIEEPVTELHKRRWTFPWEGDFQKCIWYFPWEHERDGTLEDIERIARWASVEGMQVGEHRLSNYYMMFIDRKSAEDGKVLMVGCSNGVSRGSARYPEGYVHSRGRLWAALGPVVVANWQIGFRDLIDYLGDLSDEIGGDLQHFDDHLDPDLYDLGEHIMYTSRPRNNWTRRGG